MTKDGLISEYISPEGERGFHNPGTPKEQPAITPEEMDAAAAKFLNPRTPKELPATGDIAPTARTAPIEHSNTLTLQQAVERSGVSIATWRRRLAQGKVAGAYKAAGPAGVEWRIPVASISSSEPLTVKKQETNELAELRAEVESLRVRATVAEQLSERDRQEVESLRQLLTAALEKVPKALTTGETPTRRHLWSRSK